ncbi:MAG: hypothetical protein NTY45_10140 [Elusimicrobia bacterium]|nr:hypothetical protein [Elusimicrobiota bacterium]
MTQERQLSKPHFVKPMVKPILNTDGMDNNRSFGHVLSRIRKEQGFSSAYQFFTSIGVSKSLGLAFVSYWDMERGKKLPKSWRLKTIMAALGIEQYSPQAQELARAYFKALSGSDELLRTLSVPVSAGADLPGRELAEAATDQALAQRSVNLTVEQRKLCARNMVTNTCQNFLINTAGWVTVRELADATKFKPAPQAWRVADPQKSGQGNYCCLMPEEKKYFLSSTVIPEKPASS